MDRDSGDSYDSSPEPGRGPTLLLLELVSRIQLRTHAARFYPYYQGLVRAHSLRSRWLVVGGDTETVATGPDAGSWRVDLAPDELARLEAVVAALSPSHIIANEPVSARVTDALRRAAPGARLLCSAAMFAVEGWGWVGMWCGPPQPAGEQARQPDDRPYRTGWLLRWLGLEAGAEDPFLLDAVQPDFEATLLDRALHERERPITVLGRVACDYARPIAENPAFRGVDLARAARRHGCSFCNNLCVPICGPATDPLQLARGQLEAMARSGRDPRDLRLLEFVDVRVFRQLESLVAILEDLAAPAATLFFHPRLDDVVEARDAIERTLPRLAAAGHRLHVMRVGVESFSPAENERFNKGVTTAQVDRFLALVRRWRTAWPQAFECTTQLGMILFTPWSTLDDIRVSVEAAVSRGFDQTSLWLCSVLELNERSPLALLAEHQGGILASQFDDAAMRYVSSVECTWRDGLLPWRFLEPKVAVLHAVVTRLVAARMRRQMPDAVLADDPVYRLIRDATASLGPGLPCALLTLDAVRLLERTEVAPSLPELAGWVARRAVARAARRAR